MAKNIRANSVVFYSTNPDAINIQGLIRIIIVYRNLIGQVKIAPAVPCGVHFYAASASYYSATVDDIKALRDWPELQATSITFH